MTLEISHQKTEIARLFGCMAFVKKLPDSYSKCTKQRSFMFAYHGQQYIRMGVLLDTIQYVENGVFSSNMNYCVIKLHANKTRRESLLIKIINEYNAAVGLEGHISLVALPIAGDHFFPTIMTGPRWAGNPIELKKNNDKMTTEPSFRFFTNKNKAAAAEEVAVDELLLAEVPVAAVVVGD